MTPKQARDLFERFLDVLVELHSIDYREDRAGEFRETGGLCEGGR